MIDLRGLTKRYGTFTAVDQIDLTVPTGEIFGFLGPNGAGKTTTLRMIAGILQPTAGTIHINDIDLARDPLAAKSRLGFIPDRPFIYEKLTGAEFPADSSPVSTNKVDRPSTSAPKNYWRSSISSNGRTSWSRATAMGCGRSSSSPARSSTNPMSSW